MDSTHRSPSGTSQRSLNDDHFDLQIRESVQELHFAILVGGVLGTDEVDHIGLHQ